LLFEEWRDITGSDDQVPGTDEEDAALPPVVNNQGALEALMTETTMKLTQSTDPESVDIYMMSVQNLTWGVVAHNSHSTSWSFLIKKAIRLTIRSSTNLFVSNRSWSVAYRAGGRL
jgi:hypothetical protein